MSALPILPGKSNLENKKGSVNGRGRTTYKLTPPCETRSARRVYAGEFHFGGVGRAGRITAAMGTLKTRSGGTGRRAGIGGDGGTRTRYPRAVVECPGERASTNPPDAPAAR